MKKKNPTCRACGKALRAHYVYEGGADENPDLRLVKTPKAQCPVCNQDDHLIVEEGALEGVVHCAQCSYDISPDTKTVRKPGTGTIRGYGYHSDGYFCSLRCGYNAAVAAERNFDDSVRGRFQRFTKRLRGEP